MKEFKNPDIVRLSISFSKEDLVHCFNCIHFVNYILDNDTDGEPFNLRFEDALYLQTLLCREYQTMRTLIESSGGSDNVI